MFESILRTPDVVLVNGNIADENHIDKSVFTLQDVRVETRRQHEQLIIYVTAENTPVSHVRLRWHFRKKLHGQILGDAWERAYADLGWTGVTPYQTLPWYCLIHLGGMTAGYGVMVRPGALCSWQADPEGITLKMDVRSGGSGVELGGRKLHAATVVNSVYTGMSAFAAAQAFCREMCTDPILPEKPVYGANNWYYQYVVIDDCWSKKVRNPETDRLEAEPEKFPHGMKAVADYIHDKGLKFGMYSCAGQRTCADYPGSFDHEFLDAETFASWGVDYLKYDFCYKPNGIDGPLLYRRMGLALRSCGRDILFSACNWGSDDVWSWIRSTGAHMYRSTGDIFDNPESYRNIALSQLEKLGTSAPQCYNDIDMLTVGMYGKGLVGTTGCSEADYNSQFALWCMFSAPLMLGCDIRRMDEKTLKLVTNKDLLRIDQDLEARPPVGVFHPWNKKLLTLFKHLDDGTYALGFFNMGEEDAETFATFSDFGLPASAKYDVHVRGVLNGDERTCREYMRVSVPAHDCRVYFAELQKQ